MAITLTDMDFQALTAHAEQQGEPMRLLTEEGTQYNLPKQLGEGGDRTIELRHGLTICIRDAKLRQPIRYVREHASSFPLTAKFYLSGMSRVQTLDAADIDDDYQEITGHHYLYHLPEQTEIEEWPAGTPIHVLMVFADPNYFRSFNVTQSDLSKPLKKLLDGNGTQRFHQPLGRLSPPMRQLIQQILHCPYTGLMQQLYLESKVLELLTSQFAVWTDEPPSENLIWLCAQDIEQLHHAKDILIQRASKQSPSLMELARLVGLNDRKLNQGFRQLFGTTVFGYLQDYRLRQAQDLLCDSSLTIAGVAAAVGYKNPEAFSTAFRRKFAISPKAYQLSRRGLGS